MGVLSEALWFEEEAQEGAPAESHTTGLDREDNHLEVGHTETGYFPLAWVEDHELEEEPEWVVEDPA